MRLSPLKTETYVNTKIDSKFPNLVRWVYPASYAGETWYDYFETIGRCRDSDILDNSNFEVMLERLGGESETVVVNHCGHWAVGWVESIMIHESDLKALTIANEIMADLKNYPVLDEDAFSEAESESYSEYAKQEQDDLADFLIEVFSIPVEFRDDVVDLAYQMNMETQYSGGEHSAVNHNIYSYRQDVENEAAGILDPDASRYVDGPLKCRCFDDCDLTRLLRDVNGAAAGGRLSDNQDAIIDYINAVGCQGA